MNIIRIKETESTNTLMKGMPGIVHGTVIVAENQTAGRGQRGNSWEAEPGKNLTFSLLLEPEHIPARRQFAISRAVALAICDCLRHWLRNHADEIAIKWPNDIYVGNRKICGILIENSLQADRICRTVVGIGLNVNQTVFRSDAPNPVSMAQLAGFQFDLDTLFADLAATILSYFNAEECSEGTASEREYAELLWRREGYHRFKRTKDKGQGTLRITNYELRITNDSTEGNSNYELRITNDSTEGILNDQLRMTQNGNEGISNDQLRITNDSNEGISNDQLRMMNDSNEGISNDELRMMDDGENSKLKIQNSKLNEDIFEARIVGVDPMGMLTLERRDSTRSTFAFKEVQFLL